MLLKKTGNVKGILFLIGLKLRIVKGQFDCYYW